MLIGEQTVIHLSITTDQNHPVLIAVPTDTLMQGVEVVSMSKRDTSKRSKITGRSSKDILVTSFDSSRICSPPFKGDWWYRHSLVKTDHLKSPQFLWMWIIRRRFTILKMYETAFCVGRLLSDHLWHIVGFVPDLCSCLLSNGSVVVNLWFRSRGQHRKLPPDELALKSLTKSVRRNFAARKKYEYHADYRNTLRRYMVDRFGLGAMEWHQPRFWKCCVAMKRLSLFMWRFETDSELSDYVKFATWTLLPVTIWVWHMHIHSSKRQSPKLLKYLKKMQRSQKTSQNRRITPLKTRKNDNVRKSSIFISVASSDPTDSGISTSYAQSSQLADIYGRSIWIEEATSWKVYLRHVPFVLRMLAIWCWSLCLLVLNPRNSWQQSRWKELYHDDDGYFKQYVGSGFETESSGKPLKM